MRCPHRQGLLQRCFLHSFAVVRVVAARERILVRVPHGEYITLIPGHPRVIKSLRMPEGFRSFLDVSIRFDHYFGVLVYFVVRTGEG